MVQGVFLKPGCVKIISKFLIKGFRSGFYERNPLKVK